MVIDIPLDISMALVPKSLKAPYSINNTEKLSLLDHKNPTMTKFALSKWCLLIETPSPAMSTTGTSFDLIAIAGISNADRLALFDIVVEVISVLNF